MAKIVRITIATGDDQYFIDRPYDEQNDDFSNCNSSIKWLTQLYEEHKVHAVMKMGFGCSFAEKTEDGKEETRFDPFYGATPALLNLSVLPYVTITNVGVYEQ